ncbi:MAG: radical SAM family heme chaperone HemW [bacterium]
METTVDAADHNAEPYARAAPPLALYAHFPWCVRKCPYCDFNSHRRTETIDQAGYITALLRDLRRDLAAFEDGHDARELGSIFLGGGTPSLFGADAIADLLRGIGDHLAFASDIEITLEANPGALEHDAFAAYRAAGVNRLSLGVQSFDDAQLRRLHRIHGADDARRAMRAARDGGFDNINIDLMHGLPGQDAAAATRDLDAALELAPSHVSLYQLTIEPNTWFHRHPPRLPDDDCILRTQRALQNQARARGYRRYEVSAHAQPGRECRHNLNYWRFGDYLGIGAGAHGKITRGGAITRYWKPKHPRAYLQHTMDENANANANANGGGGRHEVAADEVLFEFLLNALRLTDGFDTGLIRARTGCDTGDALALLDDAIAQRLIRVDGARVRCSEKGYRLLDEILQEILPQSQSQPQPQ